MSLKLPLSNVLMQRKMESELWRIWKKGRVREKKMKEDESFSSHYSEDEDDRKGMEKTDRGMGERRKEGERRREKSWRERGRRKKWLSNIRMEKINYTRKMTEKG